MKVYINYDDRRWEKYKINIEQAARAAAAGRTGKHAEVSITLTNDAEIHQMNKKYRGMDKPTNVLSFEMNDDELLGDIFISFDTVWKEAGGDKKEFINHSMHMVVHGVLHLLGYDHLTDKDAIKMESTEVDVLKKLGIKDPYREDNLITANTTKNGCEKIKIKQKTWLQYMIYFVLGLGASFGFAPFNLWWATLLGIGGAYYLTVRDLEGVSRHTFWASILRILPFTAAYSVGMFWWVVNSIFVVPELAAQFAIWTVPALIGIGLVGGFFFAIPFVLIRCIRQKQAYRPFLFAMYWTIILWMREWLFTGFPWNPVANITMPVPMLANSMSFWGALGLTFIIIGLIASLVEIINDKNHKRGILSGCVFGILVLTGLVLGYQNIQKSDQGIADNGPLIRIVQPARDAADKASHSRAQAMENAEKNIAQLIRLAQSEASVPDVIIFPETTYPFLVVDNNFPFAKALGVTTVMGTTSYTAGRFYNSMIVANKDGMIEKLYSKSHLVPFGEYRPFGDIIPTPGELTSGNGPEIIPLETDRGTFFFAPAICYEIIFSNALIPKDGTNRPTMIINITNDTWFGRTPGTYQHLDMVRRYAIESGIPIVRANYSGISAFVAADGRLISSLPIGQAGHLDGYVYGAHQTVYQKIGRDGWMFIILLFSLICLKSISVFQKKD